MYICNNCKRKLIQKVYLKSYVKLCKTPPGELWYNYFTVTNSKYRVVGTPKFRCEFTAKNMKLYTFFNITSIAATEKRPLSYKTPQSFHRPRYCGDQTFPLEMHYGGEKLGKEWSDFDPQRKGSYCWGSGLWCKVSSKLSGICDRRRGDRQKDRQTHRHGWFYNLSHAML